MADKLNERQLLAIAGKTAEQLNAPQRGDVRITELTLQSHPDIGALDAARIVLELEQASESLRSNDPAMSRVIDQALYRITRDQGLNIADPEALKILEQLVAAGVTPTLTAKRDAVMSMVPTLAKQALGRAAIADDVAKATALQAARDKRDDAIKAAADEYETTKAAILAGKPDARE